MTFCGCVSTAIVALLMRLGKPAAEYSVHAEGIRREQPISLSKILFHVSVAGDGITDSDMESILRQAELISPVWLAIKGNVEVETSFEIR